MAATATGNSDVEHDSHFERLRCLEQAIFVLQAYSRGFTRQQVIELCGGDEQAVDIWTHFCRELEWMKCSGEPYAFEITAKGKAMLEKYDKPKAFQNK